MRFLGVTETCDLGALYLRLIEEGHEVRVAISEPGARGTMAGMVPQVPDWRAELPWVRDGDGIVLFEAVSDGFGAEQDRLRAAGYRVIGGSAFGDRLETDRGFAQTMLAELGFPAGHVWTFEAAAKAADWLERNPRRVVAKFSGPDQSGGDNFLGQLDGGADVIAYLRQQSGACGAGVILMDFIHGIEVGIGAYFDGTRFLRPACLDWEHKRFFAGDMGELTGEMGTVATFADSDLLFERTLAKVEPVLRGHGHVGYVNLNTIVNEAGTWPLEFTCRFGYPGFAVLDPLQRTGWGALFHGMARGTLERLDVEPGFSTGVVLTTPPFPYTRKQVPEPVGLPIVFRHEPSPEDWRNIHPGEVGRVDRQLVTAGVYGWTMVVTGTGSTVGQSIDEAYRRIDNLIVPRGRYRMDIGAQVEAQIATLRSMGLIGAARCQ